jgi:MOSC domain-containing protein YiiM
MLTLAELKRRGLASGRLVWIGLRPQRRAPMRSVTEVAALAGRGLAGDRYRPGRSDKRQVSLIQAEHLVAVGRLLGRAEPPAGLLRRNLVIEGVNLIALKEFPFRIGEAVFELSGPCHPCSRMEEALGDGGYNAMRGHGGWTARVLDPGRLRLGDPVEPLC